MARPIKWSRDLHPIRETASHSRTETWSRQDIERLFGIGRASAQSLMKAMGGVQTLGAAHFVERDSLLAFLDVMIEADSVDFALRQRLLEADAPPAPRPLRVSIPHDLRQVRLRDLPTNIRLSAGKLEIDAVSAILMLESLALLAQAMQNDLDQVQALLDPPPAPPETQDADLHAFLNELRSTQQAI